MSAPITIVIPAFGAADALRRCLDSLAKCAPGECDILVADDATPDDSVRDVCRSFESALALTYVRRATNLGFVENCNHAMRSILPTGRDVLLLNSDTEITPGAVEEMSAVLHLHEKHGVVSPRSNNATIFSVPVGGGCSPEISYELWRSIRQHLPRYQVMPTAVGFCLLIKNVVLRQLGLFDPVYGPGYNEENDFVCRINRHGYSAVAANRAFVFHHESASFGARRHELDARNRQILDQRYPEYARAVNEHLAYRVDPVDRFATLWLPRRKTILISLFHLPPVHSGTSDFALSLLLYLAPLLDVKYDVTVGLSRTGRDFFANELTGYALVDEEQLGETRFDLVFKPSQVSTWRELRRLVRAGGRIAYTHQDLIAARCEAILCEDESSPAYHVLLRTAVELADRVFTISEFSRRDFAAFYGVEAPFQVIHHGVHEAIAPAGRKDGYVLIVGNRFPHKAVQRAISELQGVGDIVALGAEAADLPGVRCVASGRLSRSEIARLYDGAAVMVYPSFYEGFGMPMVDALTMGIPVVALDMEVTRELKAQPGTDQLVLVDGPAALRDAVSGLLQAPPTAAVPAAFRSWKVAAGEYAQALEDLLERDVDLALLRRRWDLLMTLDVVHPG